MKLLLKSAYFTLLRGQPVGRVFDLVNLTDQACREYGKKADPVHVWRAWHALPDNVALWEQMHALAEKEQSLLIRFSAEEKLLAQQRLIAAINTVLAAVRHDLQKGLVNVGFEEIMQQAGFKEDSAGDWKLQATTNTEFRFPIFFLRQVSEAILANQERYRAFEQRQQAYDQLMARQPAAIGWVERFSGKASAINQENEQLSATQKSAVRPIFKADLRDLKPLLQVDSLLPQLQDKKAFQDSLRLDLVKTWEKSAGQSLDMASWQGTEFVRSAVDSVIQERQLDPDLITSSDREFIFGFVGEVFSELSKLGLAAGPTQEPEPERKRKLKR